MTSRNASHSRVSARFSASCAIFGFAPLVSAMLWYFQGWASKFFAALLLPHPFYLYGIAFFFLIVAVASIIREWIHGKIPKAKLAVFFAAIAIGVGSFALLPRGISLFMLGFRHRIERSVSQEDLRKIAEIARTRIPEETTLWPKRSGLAKREDTAIWEEIGKIPGLAKMPRFILRNDAGGQVNAMWGGALCGHWGLRIYPNVPTAMTRDYAFFPISENAAVFFTD